MRSRAMFGLPILLAACTFNLDDLRGRGPSHELTVTGGAAAVAECAADRMDQVKFGPFGETIPAIVRRRPQSASVFATSNDVYIYLADLEQDGQVVRTRIYGVATSPFVDPLRDAVRACDGAK